MMPSPGYHTVPGGSECEKSPTLQIYRHEVESDASCCQEGALNLGNLWVPLAEMGQNGPVCLGLQYHTNSARQPKYSHNMEIMPAKHLDKVQARKGRPSHRQDEELSDLRPYLDSFTCKAMPLGFGIFNELILKCCLQFTLVRKQ